MKKFKAIFMSLLLIVVLTIGFVWYSFTQKYVQDSPTTATTGILFQKTLNLKEYKNISSGNSVWGKYDSYSRSDRHTEVLRIYCNEYCKK